MDERPLSIADKLGCDKSAFEQNYAIGLIENPFSNPWTVVYGTPENAPGSFHIFSCFAKTELEGEILSGQSWLKHADDFSPHFRASFSGEVIYKTIGSDGFEFIVARQYFHSLNEEQLILNQEFILLLELYRDADGNYYEVDHSGNKQIVVEFSSNKVRVKTKALIRFMSAKQLLYVQFIDSRVSSSQHYPMGTITLSDKQFVGEGYNYFLRYETTKEKDFLFSMIFARSIVRPESVEKCGIWPYEEEDEYYPEFIIEELPDGSFCSFTCDNSKLGDYFGGNPEAPHYLTPVFFKPEVLDRYRKKKNFEVSERRLSCGAQWSVEIDNVNPTRVMVFLGDLGRDLPEAERRHFKNYEISPTDQKISDEVAYQDFCGIVLDSTEGPIGRFEIALKELKTAWYKCFGTQLFRDFHEDDSNLMKQVRIPTVDNREEFETVILSLTRILVDYIDESQFPESDKDGSINKLAEYLSAQDICVDYSPLRDLQKLRSKGTAHAKSKGYDKVKEQHLSGNTIQDTVMIIERLIKFMEDLTEQLDVG